MKIEHRHQGIDYLLTNDDLQVGDKVYPIGWGCAASTGYIHYKFDWRPSMSDFPKNPHIILDRHYLDHKSGDPEEIRTNHGYGPSQQYFKIINSFDKNDYEVFDKHDIIWAPKDGMGLRRRKGVYSILVVDKNTHSCIFRIVNDRISKHEFGKDFLSKKEIEKIKHFFSLPYDGIIKPSSYQLVKVLADESTEPTRSVRRAR